MERGHRRRSQSSKCGPAITALGDTLVLAYVADNTTDDLLVTTSTDTKAWTSSALVAPQ